MKFPQIIRTVVPCTSTATSKLPLQIVAHVWSRTIRPSWTQPRPGGFRSQRYSTESKYKSIYDNGKFDESLRKMDIDGVEKELKARIGDPEDWSHEKLRNLIHTDAFISLRDVSGFAYYATSGSRPDGGLTSFALMTSEELSLMNVPYHSWAPPPYDNLDHSCFDSIDPLILAKGGGEGFEIPPYVDFYARLYPLMAKLWQGMPPISQDRWLERKMDDPRNYRNLFELMHDIVNIFEWLNHDEILRRMRYQFNWLVDRYATFEKALNSVRERNGINEKLDLTGMWAEYYHGVLSTMSNRTHQWLVDRVDEIQTRAFDEYNAAILTAGTDQKALGEAGRQFYKIMLNLGGIISRVDSTLAIPMVGFKGYVPSNNATDLSLAIREDIYAKIAVTKSWDHLKSLQEEQKRYFQEVDQTRSKPEGTYFRDYNTLIAHYHEGRKNREELRVALRGEQTPVGEQQWITTLKELMNFYVQHGKDPRTHRWGFVCYRLTYRQSDDEWADFKRKFEKDVHRSGKWIEGYDSIAGTAGIEYIDGRDVGIAEMDIEAAKHHFKSKYTMLPSLGRMWTQDFLVVDHESYESYSMAEARDERPPPPFGPCFGDRGGFVLLVDPAQQPSEHLEETSPGYKNKMKVLSTLIFEELYPLLAASLLRPRSLWPLARLHPTQVYVGHTTAAQELWWENQRLDKIPVMRMFEEMKKRKAYLDEQKPAK